MFLELWFLRITLYIVLALFATVVLGISAARIHFTLLSSDNQLTDSLIHPDPAVSELLFTSVATLIWSIYIVDVIVERREHRMLTTLCSELAGLALLFIFWLSGASAASHTFGTAWCRLSCNVFSALLAFSWLGWFLVLTLLVTGVLFGAANEAWAEPLHGRYDPRMSSSQPSHNARMSKFGISV